MHVFLSLQDMPAMPLALPQKGREVKMLGFLHLLCAELVGSATTACLMHNSLIMTESSVT